MTELLYIQIPLFLDPVHWVLLWSE